MTSIPSSTDSSPLFRNSKPRFWRDKVAPILPAALLVLMMVFLFGAATMAEQTNECAAIAEDITKLAEQVEMANLELGKLITELQQERLADLLNTVGELQTEHNLKSMSGHVKEAERLPVIGFKP